MAELDCPHPDRPSSRESNRDDISSNHASSTRSSTRSSTDSPTHTRSQSRRASPCRRLANDEVGNNHLNEERQVGGQDRDREQNHQPDIACFNQPSSDSCLSTTQNLKQPWYRRLAPNYHSISLENKGSVARDHLALERTFLAWLRTSLAFASIGIAVTQLFRLSTSFAEPQRRRQRNLNDRFFNNYIDPRDLAELPLSPLMGASLTPEIYTHIQTILQNQQYPIASPVENSALTLLDYILQPSINTIATFDSESAAKLRHMGKPLGATFLGISIVVLFIGFHRYFESQHWIIRGQFPASRGSVALVGFIAAALIVASLVVVLIVAPGAYNK